MNFRDREILHLAIPSIISNVTVPLLGLIDLAIVGHVGDATYIGAISVGTMIFNVIYWVFGFLRMGTSGLTSQALGRRDLTEVMRLLVRSVAVGLLIASCFLVFQVPLRWLAIRLIHPAADVVPLVTTYYNICIWGAPAMLCLYGFSGWFIGMQNTRIPMFVSVAQNVVNIIASLSFVFGLGMKMDGVALGTLVAQWAGAVIAFTFWLRHYTRLNHYDWRRGLFAHGSMARFFNVNRDIFLRTLFLVAVNFFFTAAGARQGNLILSVNTLLLTIYTVSSYVMDGFAFAGEALSGRYYGAGNGAAFHAVVRRLFFWGFIVSVAIMLLFAGGGKRFLSLLTDDPIVLNASSDYFVWGVCVPLAGVIAFVLDGVFIGLTATRGMLISSAIASVVFFAVYYLLFPSIHNHALWLALVVYLMMRGVVQLIYMRRYRSI